MHILRKLSKIGDPIDKEDMKGLFIPVFIYHYNLILDDLGPSPENPDDNLA